MHPPPPLAQGFALMSLEHRRRTFFKYEKRIRELSPPEKARGTFPVWLSRWFCSACLEALLWGTSLMPNRSRRCHKAGSMLAAFGGVSKVSPAAPPAAPLPGV